MAQKPTFTVHLPWVYPVLWCQTHLLLLPKTDGTEQGFIFHSRKLCHCSRRTAKGEMESVTDTYGTLVLQKDEKMTLWTFKWNKRFRRHYPPLHTHTQGARTVSEDPRGPCCRQVWRWLMFSYLSLYPLHTAICQLSPGKTKESAVYKA